MCIEDRIVCTHDCPECKGQMETKVIWHRSITGRCSECKIEVKVRDWHYKALR